MMTSLLRLLSDVCFCSATARSMKADEMAGVSRAALNEVLTKAIGEQIDIDIIEVAAWQPYEQVADQFQCGRVFLVGDAAHTMPPFKAGGANTAIQSAHNLAWKLAAVLQGTAGPALLDTYHTERHPVGDSLLANRFLAQRFPCSSSRTTGRCCRRKKRARCSR